MNNKLTEKERRVIDRFKEGVVIGFVGGTLLGAAIISTLGWMIRIGARV